MKTLECEPSEYRKAELLEEIRRNVWLPSQNTTESEEDFLMRMGWVNTGIASTIDFTNEFQRNQIRLRINGLSDKGREEWSRRRHLL